MTNQSIDPVHERTTFTFPAIFEGKGVKITVVLDKGRYGVFINDNFIARVAVNDYTNNWDVVVGELNDQDLVNEIGERIEAMKAAIKNRISVQISWVFLHFF